MKRFDDNGPGVDEPICMIDVSAGNRYYYFCDGLGSVVALLHNSAVVEMYFYDAFGRTLIYKPDTQDWDSRSSFFGNRFMFTGREFDAESRLYYYRARMYHAGIGRFLQTDPIGYADSMNLYAYCGNNPVNWIDPFGLRKADIKLIDKLVREHGLSKAGRRQLHNLITKQGLSAAEIADEAAELARQGGKWVKGSPKSGFMRGGGGAALFTVLGWFLSLSDEAGAGSMIYPDVEGLELDDYVDDMNMEMYYRLLKQNEQKDKDCSTPPGDYLELAPPCGGQYA